MKAIRIHAPGGLTGISYDEIPQPQVAPGEVLVRVYASGLSPKEITWTTSTGQLRPLPATLGFEFSGVVAALGEGVTNLSIGSEVYGKPDFKKGGTQAEYLTIQADELALKPVSIGHLEASAIPLSGLTAWQALFEQAHILPGQTVLIHGAAGGVGMFAVQLAHWAQAKIIATASTDNQAFVAGLGADELIDYNRTRFEEVVHGVDVVIDMVGGDALNRSWGVLKPGGILVTVADVNIGDLKTKAIEWGVQAVWFLVTSNSAQLKQIAELIDAGHLKPQIETVFPLSQALQAYEEGLKGHNRGKLVLQIVS